MNSTLICSLGIISLVVVGCGDVKVKSGDVNGVNAKKAKNAVFANNFEEIDFDGDGVPDLDTSTLIVVASDDDNLCDDITNDVELDDFQSAIFAVAIDDLGGVGAPIVAGTFVGDPAAQDVPLTTVLAGIAVREGGVDKAIATSIGDSTFVIDFIDADTLDGSVTGVMTRDTSDPATFNVDDDGDGVNDATKIDPPVEIEAKISNAQFCAGLAQ